jgi:hypothetical protein
MFENIAIRPVECKLENVGNFQAAEFHRLAAIVGVYVNHSVVFEQFSEHRAYSTEPRRRTEPT